MQAFVHWKTFPVSLRGIKEKCQLPDSAFQNPECLVYIIALSDNWHFSLIPLERTGNVFQWAIAGMTYILGNSFGDRQSVVYIVIADLDIFV